MDHDLNNAKNSVFERCLIIFQTKVSALEDHWVEKSFAKEVKITFMVFDNFLGKIFIRDLSRKLFLKELVIRDVTVCLRLQLNESEVCWVREGELELVFIEL